MGRPFSRSLSAASPRQVSRATRHRNSRSSLGRLARSANSTDGQPARRAWMRSFAASRPPERLLPGALLWREVRLGQHRVLGLRARRRVAVRPHRHLRRILGLPAALPARRRSLLGPGRKAEPERQRSAGKDLPHPSPPEDPRNIGKTGVERKSVARRRTRVARRLRPRAASLRCRCRDKGRGGNRPMRGIEATGGGPSFEVPSCNPYASYPWPLPR